MRKMLVFLGVIGITGCNVGLPMAEVDMGPPPACTAPAGSTPKCPGAMAGLPCVVGCPMHAEFHPEEMPCRPLDRPRVVCVADCAECE